MTSRETRILCITCTKTPPRRATPGYMTCERCVELIKGCLDEIQRLYVTVAAPGALLPQVSDGARRAPGFGSRSPANDTTIVLTDRRTTWTEEARYHNPLVVLESWARQVREEVGQAASGYATVSSEAGLLLKRMDYITRQPWVDELWRELKEVRGSLRDYNGIHKPLPVGKCPTLLSDGSTCETPLWAPLDGDSIRCGNPKCKREWTRREWLHLGHTLGVVAEGGEKTA